MSEILNLTPRDIKTIQRKLLRWFSTHKRDLPWRTEPRDPYHVWLAEIMLQQTQVGTVINYYKRWLLRFPTLESLASATPDEVLKQWEGLGYYTRARNFHKAARHVMANYAGSIPQTVEQLRLLPGIGPYTAGAIASLAFHMDVPALDGNVARVLSRVMAIPKPQPSFGVTASLWKLSAQLVPSGSGGQFNEALMDLGALVCTQRSPDCQHCPIRSQCMAYAKGKVETFPVRRTKKHIPHKDIASLFLRDGDGHVLVAQRNPTGLLGGLWEFPGDEITLKSKSVAKQLTLITTRRTGLDIHITENSVIGVIKHAFTHLRITRHIAVVQIDDIAPPTRSNQSYSKLQWIKVTSLEDLALSRSDRKILELVNTA